MEYAAENLGWSQWIIWMAEILQLEHEETEARKRKADLKAKGKHGVERTKMGGFG